MNPPPVLYHFTCRHAADHIREERVITPARHLLLGHTLAWFTDLDIPNSRLLGLTANWITCDRTEIRVTVDYRPDIVRWCQWAHTHQVPRYARELLENNGALPAHWWVSPVPVPVPTGTVHSR